MAELFIFAMDWFHYSMGNIVFMLHLHYKNWSGFASVRKETLKKEVTKYE